MTQNLKYFIVFLLLPLCVLDQMFSHSIIPSLLEGKSIDFGVFVLSIPAETDIVGIVYLKKSLIAIIFSSIMVLAYFLTNSFFTAPITGFRIGMTILVSGFITDVVSVIRGLTTQKWLHVADWSLSISQLYIILGCLVTLFFCIYHSNIVFKKNRFRKKLIIEKDQFKFCFNILASFFLFAVSIGVFFFISIKMLFAYLVENVPESIKQNVPITMLLLYIITACCFFIFVSIFTIYLSNKVYGPVFAFKKYLKEVFITGDPVRNFHLREGDHFDDFPTIIKQMNDKYKKTK